MVGNGGSGGSGAGGGGGSGSTAGGGTSAGGTSAGGTNAGGTNAGSTNAGGTNAGGTNAGSTNAGSGATVNDGDSGASGQSGGKDERRRDDCGGWVFSGWRSPGGRRSVRGGATTAAGRAPTNDRAGASAAGNATSSASQSNDDSGCTLGLANASSSASMLAVAGLALVRRLRATKAQRASPLVRDARYSETPSPSNYSEVVVRRNEEQDQAADRATVCAMMADFDSVHGVVVIAGFELHESLALLRQQ